MIDINEIVKTISTVKKNKNTLDVLLEFEGILDTLHIYAYKNWIKGEVIKGPEISKYWVEVQLMYPAKFMPDPDAALRLIKHGCFVFFQKDVLTSSVKIKSPDNLKIDKKSKHYKPKKKDISVYVVKIVIPRHLLSNYSIKKINTLDTDLDLNDIIDAYDQGFDVDRTSREEDEDEAGVQ